MGLHNSSAIALPVKKKRGGKKISIQMDYGRGSDQKEFQ